MSDEREKDGKDKGLSGWTTKERPRLISLLAETISGMTIEQLAKMYEASKRIERGGYEH